MWFLYEDPGIWIPSDHLFCTGTYYFYQSEYERAKKGAVFGVICSLTISELLGICVHFTAPQLLSAFSSTAEVIRYGAMQAHTDTFFYFLLAFSHCMAGIMRGAGKSTVPMYVMLVCWCLIRVSYIVIILKFIPSIQMIFWAYPMTWALSSIAFLIYFCQIQRYSTL